MDRYVSGQGNVYIAPLVSGAPQGFSSLGNCRSLVFSPGSRYLREATDISSGGVVPLVYTGDEPATFTMVLDNISKENLALVLSGASQSVPINNTTEILTAYSLKSIVLKNLGLEGDPLVRNAALSITYTLGTDYTVDRSHGIITIPAGSSITDGQSLNIWYIYKAQTQVGSFTSAPKYYRVHYAGINTVYGKTMSADFFKCKLDIDGSIDLLGENMTELTIKGTAMVDQTQPSDIYTGKICSFRWI